MNNPKSIETMNAIAAIEKRVQSPLFLMSLALLFENGRKNFTPKNVEENKKDIQKRKKGVENGSVPILSSEFESELLDVALELSGYEICDLLLYVRLNIHLNGDDMNERKYARECLQHRAADWRSPDTWQQVVEDEEWLEDAVSVLIEKHRNNGYTHIEIRETFEEIVDRDYS